MKKWKKIFLQKKMQEIIKKTCTYSKLEHQTTVHQMLGQWDDRLNDPAYHFENCWIFGLITGLTTAQFPNTSYKEQL